MATYQLFYSYNMYVSSGYSATEYSSTIWGKSVSSNSIFTVASATGALKTRAELLALTSGGTISINCQTKGSGANFSVVTGATYTPAPSTIQHSLYNLYYDGIDVLGYQGGLINYEIFDYEYTPTSGDGGSGACNCVPEITAAKTELQAQIDNLAAIINQLQNNNNSSLENRVIELENMLNGTIEIDITNAIKQAFGVA